jgi:hypothetical protein
MNFEQVFQKASVACFSGGRRSEDHLIEVTEMIAYSRQPGPRRRSVKCVGLPPGLSLDVCWRRVQTISCNQASRVRAEQEPVGYRVCCFGGILEYTSL